MARRRAQPAKKCPACSETSSGKWRCERCGGLLETNGFRVEALLAVSPRGRVYRAKRGRGRVALKEVAFAVVPNVETLERFEREAQVLTALDHPLIPKTLAWFSDGEGPERRLYLAQEYLEGVNLEQRLARHFFDEAEAVRIASDLLDVLGYLHTRSPQVIHRDVKPSNVIARSDGRYALVDFGAVRLPGAEGALASLVGTFGFMPPEQLARHADGRSDLYALGMTLISLLSRRPAEELVTSELTVNFRGHVNVSEPFADFLAKLVARDPKDRFQGAIEAKVALRASAASLISREEARLNETKAAFVISPKLRSELDSEPQKQPAPTIGEAPTPPRTETVEIDVSQGDGGVAWVLSIGGQRYRIRSGSKVTLGRSMACDIPIASGLVGADTVSRGHAELSVTRAGLAITDLGSRNGTLVGAVLLRALGRPMVIQEPTSIRFGSLCAEVRPAFFSIDRERPPEFDEAGQQPRVVRRLRLLNGPSSDSEHVRIARIVEERIPGKGRTMDPLSRKRLMDHEER